LIEEVCGIGVSAQDVDAARERLVHEIEARRNFIEHALIVIVPTAPVLYPEDLPEWLRAQCAQSVPPAQRVLATWPPALAKRLYYPIAEMRELEEITEAIPRTNFHWYGTAPHQIARMIAARFLGKTPSLGIAAAPKIVQSDIAFLSPGANWVNEVMEPDFTQAGVNVCRGLHCHPELNALQTKVSEISTYSRSGAPGGSKLLLLTDSFGDAIAGYFIEYYDQVVQVNVNQIESFTPDQVELFDQWRQAQQAHFTVLLFHDGALRGVDSKIKLLWPTTGAAGGGP
jgi:hypothetical protein